MKKYCSSAIVGSSAESGAVRSRHIEFLKSTALAALIAAGTVSFLLIDDASAQQFWDGDANAGNNMVDGGNGTWDLVLPNFTDATGTVNLPYLLGNGDVVFGGAPGTVTVGATPIPVSAVTFAVDGYTVQNGTITLNGAGPVIGQAVTEFNVAAGQTATISSIIANGANNGLGKSGGGNLILSGSNTFTDLVVGGGTLTLASATAFQGTGTIRVGGATLDLGSNTIAAPNGLVAQNATVSNGTLTLGALAQVQNANISANLAGTGGINVAPGTVTLSGNNTFTGTISLDANDTIVAASSTALGAVAGGTTVAAGGSLHLSGGFTIAGEALSIAGTGQGGNGALRSVSGQNTYGGAITLSAAAEIQADNAANTNLRLSGGVDTNAQEVTFDSQNTIIVSSVITGTGSVVSQGTANTRFSAANDYTGTTSINVGRLVVTGGTTTLGTADGTAATGTTIASGASLQLTNAAAIGDEALVINGNGGGGGTGNGALRSNGATTNIYGGDITVNTDTKFRANGAGGELRVTGDVAIGGNTLTVDGAGNTTISGNVTGVGGNVTRDGIGTGTLLLSGTNTYNGTTTVSDGTLSIVGGTLVSNVINANGTGGSAGTFLTDGGLSDGAVVTLGGDATFDVDGNETITALISAVTGTTANIAAGTTLTVNGTAGTTTMRGIVEGAGGLTKGSGTGIVALTNANTYTGATNVNAGVLQLGSTANTNAAGSDTVATIAGATSVNSGGTFRGNGTTGDMTVLSGGTLQPGLSPGTLTVANLTVNAGGTVDFELNTPGQIGGGGPTGNDLIVVQAGGTAQIDPASTFDFVNTAPDEPAGLYRLINTQAAGAVQTSGGGAFTTVLTAGATPVRIYTTGNGQFLNAAIGAITTQYWDGGDAVGDGTVDGGPGTWNVANSNWTTQSGALNDSWQGTVSPPVTGIFQTVGGAVTVAGTQGFGGLQFDVGGYTLSGGTLNANDTDNSSEIVTNAGTTIISSVISGATPATGITKQGAETLVLGGVNTYTGATRVEAGVLQINASERIADGSDLTMIGGTFDLNNFTETVANLSGTGGNIDTGGTSGGLTVNQTVAGTYGGDFSGATALGTDPLQKNGAATLTLGGTNTQTGNGVVEINAGTLQVQNGNAIGNNQSVRTNAAGTSFELLSNESIGNLISIAGSTTVLNGNTLTLLGDATGAVVNSNALGVISGTGGGIVVNNGNDVQTFSAANTYTGATIVNGGTLQANNASALGINGTVAVNAPGTLELLTALSIGSLAGNGTVTNNANTLTTGGNNASTAFSGVIGAGAGGLIKNGTGTQTLSGINTYTGATAVNGGTLLVDATGAINNSTAVSTALGATLDVDGGGNAAIGDAVAVTNAGTFVLTGSNETIGSIAGAGGINLNANTLTTGGNGNTTTVSGIISGGGGLTKEGAGIFTLTANNTYTGATTVNTGVLHIGNGGATGTIGNDSNVAINAPGALHIERNNTYTYGGVVSGDGTLIQEGTGETILTANSGGFTGITNVNAGILQVDGQLGGTVNVNAGSRLEGTGTVSTAGLTTTINAGGTLAAGNSPGTLNIAGNLVLAAGSTSEFEFGTPGVIGGATNDLVNVGGNLTVAGTLNLGLPNTFVPGPPTAIVSGFYNLFDVAGTTAGAYTTINNGGVNAIADVTQIITNSGAASSEFNILLNTGGQIVQFWDGAEQNNDPTDIAPNGGNGTWNAANSNWTTVNGQINSPWQSQVGVFGNTAGTVTVNGAQNFQGLQFTTTGYVVNGPGTLNMTGDAFGNAAASFFNTDAGVTATVNAVVSGNAGIGLDKLGGGTLVLGGDNTYTGTTSVNAGTLVVNATGDINESTAVNIAGGATLDVDGGGNAAIGDAVAVTNSGTLILTGSNETIGSIAGAGGINLNANTMTTGGNGNSTTVSGAISGTGNLTKEGAGVFTLSGDNTYSGITTVNAGTLLVNATGDINESSAIVIGLNGTLDVNGGGNAAIGDAVAVTNTGNFVLTGNDETIGSIAGSGGINLNANRLTTGGNNTSTTVSGVITGAGGVTKTGTGTFTLSGANNYTGDTNVENGGLTVAATGVIAGSTIVNGAAATLTNDGTVAAVAVTDGTFVNNAQAGAVTNSDVTNNNAGGTIASLVNNAGTTTNAGIIAGTTTVNGGTLDNNAGSTANGGVTIAAGGTATNAGTINAGVTNNSAAAGFTNEAGGQVNGGLTNTATATNQAGGTIDAVANSGTFTNNGTVTNNLGNTGTATNNGTAGSVSNSNIFTNNNIIAGIATNTAGTFTNNAGGTIGGLVTSTGGVFDNNGGTLNGGLNNSTVFNSNNGTLNGPVNNMAAGVFNLAGTTLGNGTFNNNGTFNTTGTNVIGGPGAGFMNFNNNGLLNSMGTLTVNAAAASNSGTINLGANDALGDTVNFSGNLNATGTFNIDIDLSRDNLAGEQLSDRINVASLSGGGAVINFDQIGAGVPVLQTNPVVVIDSAGANTTGGSFTATGLPPASGILLHQLVQLGNDYVVLSQVNPAAGGIAGNITLVQSLIGSVVNRPTSPFVSGVVGVDEPVCGPGSFLRGTGGQGTASGDTFNQVTRRNTEIDVKYTGIQFAIDFGCYNTESGFDVSVGTFGGYNSGDTTQDVFLGVSTVRSSVTFSDFAQGYFGGYVTVAKDSFSADLQARYGRTEFTFNNPSLGLVDSGLDSDRYTLSGSATYTKYLSGAFDSVSLRPFGGFALSHTESEVLNFAGNLELAPEDFFTAIGFVGITIAKDIVAESGTEAYQPFFTATVYNDFGDDPNAIFTDTNSGVSQVIESENLGAFAEFSLGFNYVKILDESKLRQLTTSFRADYKIGDQVEGFGVTGQVRLQF